MLHGGVLRRTGSDLVSRAGVVVVATEVPLLAELLGPGHHALTGWEFYRDALVGRTVLARQYACVALEAGGRDGFAVLQERNVEVVVKVFFGLLRGALMRLHAELSSADFGRTRAGADEVDRHRTS